MTKRLTRDEIEERVFNKYGDDFIYIEQEYKNANTPIKLKCSECGHLKSITMNRVVSEPKTGCIKCSGLLKYTTEEMREKISKMTDREYELVSDYKSAHEYMTIRHNSSLCNFNEYEVKWANFNKGTRCPDCSFIIGGKKKTKNSGWRDSFLNGLEDEGHSLLSDRLKRKKDKVLIKNNTCDHGPFSMTPDHFMRGQRCPKCYRSTGEESISEYLISNEVSHEEEYIFPDLDRNGTPLRFDFALFSESGSLIGLIEYDGGQHFKPIDFFGGIEKFKIQQENDSIKNDYCKKSSIPLLRIPYWEFENIERIVGGFLTNLNGIKQVKLK